MKKLSTVVGVFNDHIAAIDAIKDLRQSGFSDDQIGFVVRHSDTSQEPDSIARGIVDGLLGNAHVHLFPEANPGETDVQTVQHTPKQEIEQSATLTAGVNIVEKQGTSIITGSVIGGTLGAIAAMHVPAIGPLVAGGLLAATFGGAIPGNIAGGLSGIGIPEHKARYYEEQFHAGRIIFTIKTADQQSLAQNILHHYGAKEIGVF